LANDSERSKKKLCVFSLYHGITAGIFGNNILPARGGELVRVYLLAKQESLSKSMVLASVVLERIADLIIACLLLGTIALIYTMPPWLKEGGVIIGAIAITALLFLLILESVGSRLFNRFLILISFFPEWIIIRIRLLFENFLEGIKGLLNMRAAAGFLLLTSLIWIIDISIIWFLARAFHLELSISNCLIAQLFAIFSGLIPALPGQLGAFEFAVVSGLKAMDIESEIALVFAFGWHIYYFAITSILGIISLTLIDSSILSSYRSNKFK